MTCEPDDVAMLMVNPKGDDPTFHGRTHQAFVQRLTSKKTESFACTLRGAHPATCWRTTGENTGGKVTVISAATAGWLGVCAYRSGKNARLCDVFLQR